MKRIISVLLTAVLVFSLFAVMPVTAEAATPHTYVYSSTMNIDYYDSYGRSATYHAAIPTLRKIPGSYVNTLQKKLNYLYTYEKKRCAYLYKQHFSYTPKIVYTAYLCGSVLSIYVVIQNYNMTAYSRYAFGINVKTGKQVTNAALLNRFGLTANQAKKLVVNSIQKDLNSGKSVCRKYFSQYGYKYYKHVIDLIGQKNVVEYFLDGQGNLNMCYYAWWTYKGEYIGYSLKCRIRNASAVATPATAYPKVTLLTNVSGGVRIAWTKVTGAAKYRLFYKTSAGWKRFGTDGTVTSCTINQLTAGKTYTFTIRAIGKNGKYVGTYRKRGWSIFYSGNQ